MMQVQVIDNRTRNLISTIAPVIEASHDMRIAVAFVSQSGLDLIYPSLEIALGVGGSVEFLVGLDMQTTEPAALRTLFGLSSNQVNASLYCYATSAPAAIYHPKLYLLDSGDQVTSIVGSSNLTAGGLKRNIEVNVMLTGGAQDEPISDCYSIYNRLKYHPDRVLPDEEYITLYTELCQHTKRAARSIPRQGAANDLLVRLKAKSASLRHPPVTSKDLVGWLRIVYNALPTGEFTNRDVYEMIPRFLEYYPTNNNPEAKVRQQLQMLHAMKLVEHTGRGRWRKLSSDPSAYQT